MANGMTDEGKKRSILLSVCGTPTYKQIKMLVAPAAVMDVTFDEIAALIQTHYQSKPSVIRRWFHFNTCVLQPGENITAFIARLWHLASHCEYGDNTVELIRDRIVCGIRDDALQCSLLSILKLTFDKACEQALTHELAEQNSKVLSAPTSVHRNERDASATAHPKVNDRNQAHLETPCYHCGGQHSAKSCRFKDSVCNFCRKKGHIQCVCRSHCQESPHTPAQPKWSQQHQTYRLDKAPPTPPPLARDYTLFAVSVDRVAPFTAVVEIDGADLRMEIDTWAAVSLISESTYSHLWSVISPPTVSSKAPHLLREGVRACQWDQSQSALWTARGWPEPPSGEGERSKLVELWLVGQN